MAYWKAISDVPLFEFLHPNTPSQSVGGMMEEPDLSRPLLRWPSQNLTQNLSRLNQR
ncbi:hypothetical protein [Pseudomaricurvus sp.]|uniref:hypothetical protein n=1 Tax=Pseudomaricurvus sp. TaxID=2004510 RepID=UPI003F6CAC2B